MCDAFHADDHADGDGRDQLHAHDDDHDDDRDDDHADDHDDDHHGDDDDHERRSATRLVFVRGARYFYLTIIFIVRSTSPHYPSLWKADLSKVHLTSTINDFAQGRERVLDRV